MISTRWLEARKPHWDRLEALLESAGRRGLSSLGRSDLRELGLLYRQAAADLATAREDPSSRHFASYLNQLLARAHNTIYAGRRGTALSIVRCLAFTYPRVFRQHLPLFALAVGVFATAAVVGALATWLDPEFELRILGPEMVRTIRRREMWTHSILAIKPLASSAIMTNNLSVAFTTFAAGISAGLGTLYMIAFNGLLIGVIGMACAMAGMSVELWSFVAPHGVLELPAIFIAGAAGLRLAQGLLFPGTLPRRDSLARAGSEATRLVVGTVPLLIVAGVIEAFLSPTGLAPALKFIAAGALFTLLVAYLLATTAGSAPSPTGRS